MSGMAAYDGHLLALAADVEVGAKTLIHDIIVPPPAPEEHAGFTVLRWGAMSNGRREGLGRARHTEDPCACVR